MIETCVKGGRVVNEVFGFDSYAYAKTWDRLDFTTARSSLVATYDRDDRSKDVTRVSRRINNPQRPPRTKLLEHRDLLIVKTRQASIEGIHFIIDPTSMRTTCSEHSFRRHHDHYAPNPVQNVLSEYLA